jgi:hypothetical protein
MLDFNWPLCGAAGAAMRRMDVRDLTKQSADDLATGDTITLEKDGKVLGYFVPVNWRDPEEVRRSHEAFDRAVERARAEGTTTEEIIDALDLRPTPR